jgi:hypothetical protein
MKKAKNTKTATTAAKDKKLVLLKSVVHEHLSSVTGGWDGCTTTLNSCYGN